MKCVLFPLRPKAKLPGACNHPAFNFEFEGKFENEYSHVKHQLSESRASILFLIRFLWRKIIIGGINSETRGGLGLQERKRCLEQGHHHNGNRGHCLVQRGRQFVLLGSILGVIISLVLGIYLPSIECFNPLGGSMSDSQTTLFCSSAFPELWSRFVTTVVDSYNSKRFYARKEDDEAYCRALREKLGGGAHEASCEKQPVKPPQTVLPKAEKIIAIGDIHGDISKARRAFRLAGLIDEHDSWVGGKSVCVQVGDVLDRGNNEVEIYYWFERLQREAQIAGGALHVLNGNHETMNIAKQFRYATEKGTEEFNRWAHSHAMELALKAKCMYCPKDRIEAAKMYLKASQSDGAAARSAALQPGGDFSRRFIAPNPVVLQVGSTVFVQGSLLTHHVEYGIEKINKETHDWIVHGKVQEKPAFLSGRKAVVWARDFSNENPEQCDCEALQQSLSKIPGAKRMVVGHTIQGSGINSACSDQVYRVDVGLSRGCGDGTPEVLVIYNDSRVVTLKENEEAAESEASKKLHKLEKLSGELLHS